MPTASPGPDTPEFRLGEGRISGVLSLLLGGGAFLGVLCFRYPGMFSVPTVTDRLDVPLLRNVLFLGLVLAGVLALVSAVLQWRGRLWMGGLALTVGAWILGGHEASAHPHPAWGLPIGLDWFVVDLLLMAALFVPLERWRPQRRQRIFRPRWSTDLGYFALTHLLIQVVVLVTTGLAFHHLHDAILPGVGPLLRGLPFWAAFPVALFVADVLQVGIHRAYHRSSWLWPMHAVHHSVQHMDWLAGSRLHLLEVLATRMGVFLPLYVLGFAEPVLYAYVAWVGVQATWVHANLGWRLGWLEPWLVTPRYHHWHHALDAAYVDANYAIHLPVVDWLFGTRVLPRDGWPLAYGVLEDEVPEGLWAQHVHGLRGLVP